MQRVLAAGAAVDPAAETLDFRRTVGLQHDVLRPKVSVRNALTMRVLDRVGDARDHACAVHEVRPPAAGDQFMQQSAAYPFDRHVARVMDPASLEHGDDVRVMQLAGGLRLAHERLLHRCNLRFMVVADVVWRRPFDGLEHNLAMHYRIASEIRHGRAFAPQLAQNRVAADLTRHSDGSFIHEVRSLSGTVVARAGGLHRFERPGVASAPCNSGR